MGSWFTRFRASWLFVIGFLLVYFGASGALSAASQFWPFPAEPVAPTQEFPDEGFAPWMVPLDASTSGSAPELEYENLSLPEEFVETAAPTESPVIVTTPRPTEDEVVQPTEEVLPPVIEVIENTPTPEILVATPLPLEQEPAENPQRIVIHSINLDAPIIETATEKYFIEGNEYEQWLAPNEYAGGWHNTSAKLGEIGNTVINGHHNIYGMVFGGLVNVTEGDLIIVKGSKREFYYLVTNKMILPEKSVGLAQRLENARWILPSEDERLTLVTCWPFESNSHRLIVVARPVGQSFLSEE